MGSFVSAAIRVVILNGKEAAVARGAAVLSNTLFGPIQSNCWDIGKRGTRKRTAFDGAGAVIAYFDDESLQLQTSGPTSRSTVVASLST